MSDVANESIANPPQTDGSPQIDEGIASSSVQQFAETSVPGVENTGPAPFRDEYDPNDPGGRYRRSENGWIGGVNFWTTERLTALLYSIGLPLEEARELARERRYKSGDEFAAIVSDRGSFDTGEMRTAAYRLIRSVLSGGETDPQAFLAMSLNGGEGSNGIKDAYRILLRQELENADQPKFKFVDRYDPEARAKALTDPWGFDIPAKSQGLSQQEQAHFETFQKGGLVPSQGFVDQAEQAGTFLERIRGKFFGEDRSRYASWALDAFERVSKEMDPELTQTQLFANDFHRILSDQLAGARSFTTDPFGNIISTTLDENTKRITEVQSLAKNTIVDGGTINKAWEDFADMDPEQLVGFSRNLRFIGVDDGTEEARSISYRREGRDLAQGTASFAPPQTRSDGKTIGVGGRAVEDGGQSFTFGGRNLGTTAWDPTPQEMFGSKGNPGGKALMSPRELERTWLNYRGKPEILEALQRDLWEAGMYGDTATEQGLTPYWGRMDDATEAAIRTAVLRLQSNGNGNYNLDEFWAREKAEAKPVHERAGELAEADNAEGREPVITTWSAYRRSQIEAATKERLRQMVGRDTGLTDEITAEVNALVEKYASQQHQARVDLSNRTYQAQVDAGLIKQKKLLDSRGYEIDDPKSVSRNTSGKTTYSEMMGPMSSLGYSDAHVERVLAAIRQHESNGSYTARNPNSSAGGAYQFVDKTWLGAGGTPYGTPDSNGRSYHAALAPREEQDRIARASIIQKYQNYGNWEDTIKSWIYPKFANKEYGDTPIPNHGGYTTNMYASDVMSLAFGDAGLTLGVGNYDPFAIAEAAAIGVTQDPTDPSVWKNAQGERVEPNIPYATKNSFGDILMHGQLTRQPGQIPGTQLVQIPSQFSPEEIQGIAEDRALLKYEPEIKSLRLKRFFDLMAGS